MTPFKLKPALKDYIWGGTKLITEYGKAGDLTVVAESWELSAHPAGMSTIASGEWEGLPFGDFIQQFPAELGTSYKPQQGFPLLVKLIDARQSLSIQVHPTDAYANRVEKDNGKTEIWIVLESEPDAFLYVGFEKEISKEEMQQRIANDTLTEVLHRQRVQQGDVIYIPAGTIHAIGAGIVLAEVQQSSNATYRVYDFGRLGVDGKPRELHVAKALDVACVTPANPIAPAAGQLGRNTARLVQCPFFTVDRINVQGSYVQKLEGSSFVALLVAVGSAELCCQGLAMPIRKGETVFIPSSVAEYTLKGAAELLCVML